MNPFPFEPITRVPPPADDSPVARLAHTIAIFDELPDLRPADDAWAVTATTYAYPGGPTCTGLTWGDLRALLADLTACPMCLTNCGHPEQCGAELDEPEELADALRHRRAETRAFMAAEAAAHQPQSEETP